MNNRPRENIISRFKQLTALLGKDADLFLRILPAEDRPGRLYTVDGSIRGVEYTIPEMAAKDMQRTLDLMALMLVDLGRTMPADYPNWNLPKLNEVGGYPLATDKVFLHSIAGTALKSGIDRDGLMWVEFTVDEFADQESEECAFCHRKVYSGWMCPEGGDVCCNEHVVWEEASGR